MNSICTEFKERLRRIALSCGASQAAWIDPPDIPILEELRDLCRQNSCGQYNTSWAGPPAIGDVSELATIIRSCAAGLVVQTVGQLEDSYDYPGMLAAKEKHQETIQCSLREFRQAASTWRILPLSAGCCQICDPCTYPDEPCRRPEEAIAPVEAYGIYVNAMLTACGLKYNNGPATISYAGLILLCDKKEPVAGKERVQTDLATSGG